MLARATPAAVGVAILQPVAHGQQAPAGLSVSRPDDTPKNVLAAANSWTRVISGASGPGRRGEGDAGRAHRAAYGLVAPLLLPEAVGKTSPQGGASIGRGTTVFDAAPAAWPGGTKPPRDANSGCSVPPLRAQPIPSYLPDSLASKRQRPIPTGRPAPSGVEPTGRCPSLFPSDRPGTTGCRRRRRRGRGCPTSLDRGRPCSRR